MKIKTVIIFLFFVFVPVLVFAKNQAALPSAGLTPENPFYFLDKLGEALQEFFTFDPERKARLQITFAAERIAEIKVILETKGVEAEGLDVAQARLQEHLGNAVEIVIKQKGKGKNVSKLVKELDDDFDKAQSVLEQSFEAEERALEAREEQVEQDLGEARRIGDTARITALSEELAQIEAEEELLELKEEELENKLEAEEEKMEEEMEAREEAEEAIEEAEEEREEEVEGMEEDKSGPSPIIQPIAGNRITIKDCKADPSVLQVSKGAVVTIVNSDDEKHTLSFYDFSTGGQGNLELPAEGVISTVKLSAPVNFTNNFSCDQKTLPYGGAVYVAL